MIAYCSDRYVRGAAGLWIENGELAYPVSEVTIAGNLQEMLLGILAIGNDLEFRGSMASPTVLIYHLKRRLNTKTAMVWTVS